VKGCFSLNCLIGDYQLYDDICKFPDSLIGEPSWVNHIVEGATRSVCRQMCNTVFDQECSGFLFIRDENTCVLSPYTGEWTDGSNDDQCNNTNVEFYRRHRAVGRSASYVLSKLQNYYSY
jgi:PAN domain